MSTLCSKLRRIYDDKVHFFATAVEYYNDDIKANVEDSLEKLLGNPDSYALLHHYIKFFD